MNSSNKRSVARKIFVAVLALFLRIAWSSFSYLSSNMVYWTTTFADFNWICSTDVSSQYSRLVIYAFLQLDWYETGIHRRLNATQVLQVISLLLSTVPRKYKTSWVASWHDVLEKKSCIETNSIFLRRTVHFPSYHTNENKCTAIAASRVDAKC